MYTWSGSETCVYLHISQCPMIAKCCGEVVFQDGDCTGERYMAAPTKEGHTGEAEDGGDQGSVGNTAQTLDAAFKAAWTHKQQGGGDLCYFTSSLPKFVNLVTNQNFMYQRHEVYPCYFKIYFMYFECIPHTVCRVLFSLFRSKFLIPEYLVNS